MSDRSWDYVTEVETDADGRPVGVRGDIPFVSPDTPDPDMRSAFREFLRDNAAGLGLPDSFDPATQLADLGSTVRANTATIMRFQQRHEGRDVLGRGMTVVLDPETNRIRQITLHYARPVVPPPAQEAPPISAEEARKRALRYLEELLKLPEPVQEQEQEPEDALKRALQQVYFPSSDGAGLRLAWQVTVAAREPVLSRRLFVDAVEGKVLEDQDLIVAYETGNGRVFDPNPVVMLDEDLKYPLETDAEGQAALQTRLNDLLTQDPRAQVQLQGLAPQDNGVYRLTGQYVIIADLIQGVSPSGENLMNPPATSPTADFRYNVEDPHFGEVMVYYHVDAVQRYLQQTLGIDYAHKSSPVKADVRAEKLLDGEWHTGGWYDALRDTMYFGLSSEKAPDRAHDADCILHEYGHALVYNMVPGWGRPARITNRKETRAIGEAFGDLLACIYFANRTGNADRRPVFEDWIYWKSKGQRRLNNDKKYPHDWVNLPDGSLDPHRSGEIWSGAIWEIFTRLVSDMGSLEEAQKLVLRTLIESIARCQGDENMRDLAQRMLDAHAGDSYRGKYARIMLEVFCERGLLLAPANASLYIQRGPGDSGSGLFNGVLTTGPAVWVRNQNDPTAGPHPQHQEPKAGQDNWVYAAVKNRGTANSGPFVVTFTLKDGHTDGSGFRYPSHFTAVVSGAVGGVVARPNSPTGGIKDYVVSAKIPKEIWQAGTPQKSLLVCVHAPGQGPAIAANSGIRNSPRLALRNVRVVP